MRRALKQILLIVLQLLWAMPSIAQLSGTYTIGGTNPSYTTINAAVTALNSSGINGPTTFNIRSGVYTEQVNIDSIPGISSTNTVKFRTDPASASNATISFGSDHTIGINAGASYVTFEDLTLETTGSTGSTRVICFLGDNHHITFNNDSIIGYSSSNSNTFQACLYSTSNFKTNDLVITNNVLLNGSYGMYLYSSSSDRNENIRIADNIALNFSTRAIYVVYSDYVTVEDNYFESGEGSFNYGIYIYRCNLINVHRNQVVLYNSGGSYPLNISYCEGLNGDSSYVTNNMASQLGDSATTVYNSFTDNSSLQIVYNSFYGEAKKYNSYGLVSLRGGFWCSFVNNCVYNNGAAQTFDPENFSSPILNNNIYEKLSFSSNRVSSLDPSNFSILPDYVSKYDLRLASSGLNNRAIHLPYVTTDIDGVVRSFPSTVGAHVYVPIPNDARISELLPKVICNGSNSLSFKLQNNGNNTLQSVNYQFNINGTSAAAGSLSNLNLLAGEDTLIGLGNHSFLESSYYNIEIFTSSPNGTSDGQTSNDTLTIDSLQTGLSGNYSVGGIAADFSNNTEVLNRIVNWGVCGQVTFNLADTNFIEQLVVRQIPGASAINSVKFKSANSNGAKISYNSDFVVEFKSGVQHVSFDSLTLEATGNHYVVEFSGDVKNIAFNDDSLIGTTNSSISSLYSIFYATSSLYMDSFTVSNCKIINGSYGFYFYGSGSATRSNLKFTNNSILDFNSRGFYLGNTSGLDISNNFVRSKSNAYSLTGIYLLYCSEIKINSNYINTSANGYGRGMDISRTSSKVIGQRNQVLNNEVIMPSPSSSASNYNYFNFCDSLDIVNNSFYGVGNSTTTGLCMLRNSNSSVFQNNSVYNNGAGPALLSIGDDTVRYNNLYVNDSTFAVIGKPVDSTNISVNPFYASDSSLQSPNYSLLGRGLYNPIVQFDKNGVSRKSIPDIGAFEKSPPSVDAGIDDLIILPTCAGNAANIQVLLRNGGNSVLSSVSIGWALSVNEGPFMAQNNFSFTGNLASMSDSLLTIGSLFIANDSLYRIKVYSFSPNSLSDTYSLNDTLYTTTSEAFNGEYFVGGANPDFVSISEAVNNLKIYGVCGPTRIIIRDSIYEEQVELNDIPGLSNVNTLEFVADQNNAGPVRITYSPLSSIDNYTVRLINASHITLDSLEITSGGSTYSRAIVFERENDSITISNCSIIGYENATTSTSASLIYMGNYDELNNSSIKHNTFQYGSNSLELKGLVDFHSEGLEIENNKFENYYYQGIYLSYQYNANIISNDFESNSTYSFLYHSYLFRSNNIKFKRNNIYHEEGAGYGVYLSSSGSLNGDSTIVSNNMVSLNSGNTSNSPCGIYISANGDEQIINNNVLVGGGTSSRALYVSQVSGNGATIKNNSLVNLGAGYAFYHSNYNYTFNMDYNNLYTNGANLAYADYGLADLAAWQARYGDDSNSVSINPIYKSVNDLHVERPTLHAKGIFIPGHSEDFDGDVRMAGLVEIGADERNFIANDAGLDSIVIDNNCPFNTAKIKVRLVNYGTSPLTSATINLSIATNGGSYVNQTPFNFSGNLPSAGDTVIEIGSTSVSLEAQYDIKSFTSLVNGQADVSNDNDSIELSSGAKFTGTYFIGGASPDFVDLKSVIDAMKVRGVCGAVTLNVRSGTYPDQLDLSNIDGLSISSKLVIQKDPSSASNPVITYGGQKVNQNFTIGLSNVEYVRFKHLDISAKSTSGTYNSAINFYGDLSNIIIDSCNISALGISSNSNSSAIYKSSASNVSDLTISNSTISGGSYGIYLFGSSSNKDYNCSFTNNNIVDFYYKGIYVYYSDSIRVENNSVSVSSGANTISSNLYGIHLTNCDDLTVNSNRTYMPNHFGFGIYLNYCDNTHMSKGVVSNNSIFIGDASSSSTSYGLYLSRSTGVKLYNNTSYVNSESSSSQALYYFGLTSGSANNIINNNLYARKGYAAYYFNINGINSIGHNNYFTPSTNTNFAYLSGAKNDLSTLVAATGDTNSVNIDPQFVSTTNLLPGNHSLDSLGMVLSEVTVDILDSVRNVSHPDIGAFEFGASAPCSGLSGVYTVGGTTPYFATISDAVDSLNLVGVCDNVVFDIRQGSYMGKLGIREFTNVDEKWIVFRADPTNTLPVIIQDSLSTSEPTLLALDSVGNIEFNNIEFEVLSYSSSKSNTAIVNFRGDCGDLEFINCSFNGNDNAIYGFGKLTNNNDYTFKNMTIDSCNFSGVVVGLKMAESSATLKIKNSIFDNISQNTIRAVYVDTVIIENNYLSSEWTIAGVSVADKAVIRKNKVYSNTGQIAMAFDIRLVHNFTNGGVWNEFSNNEIHLRRNLTIEQGRLVRFYYSSFFNVYNNSIYFSNGVENTKNTTLFEIEGNSHDFNIVNNNMALDANGLIYTHLKPVGTPPFNHNFHHNNLWCKDDTLAFVDSVYYTSIDSLQSIGYDSNSISINPIFISDTSLIPHVYELVDAGISLPEITDDILGMARDASPSIGAYEYTYACGGLSGTYTIGGSSPDYTSISAAVADLNKKGICDDVIFNIRQGTYTDSLISESWYNATDSGFVTFQADPLNTADVILTANLNAGSQLWGIDGSNGIRIKGLHFTATGNGEALIALLDETKDIIIEDCSFDGNLYHFLGSSPFSGDFSSPVDSLKMVNNTFKNNRLNFLSSIALVGFPNGQSRQIIIDSNSFENCGTALFFNSIDSTVVSNNSIKNTANALIFDGVDAAVIEKNNIHVLENGINLLFANNKLSPLHIYNNVIVSDHGFVIGNDHASSDSINLNFNTLVSGGESVLKLGSPFGAGSVSYAAKNNIVMHRNEGLVVDAYGTSAGLIFDGDYNNYFTDGDTIIRYTDASATSLSDIQTLGRDSNSYTFNPYFLSDTLLKPYRQALHEAGTPIAGISTDIEGTTRINPPDIGAFQFDPIVFDVSIDSMRIDTACSGERTVDFLVTNNGDSVITKMFRRSYVKPLGGTYSNSQNGTTNLISFNNGDSRWIYGGAFDVEENASYTVKIAIDSVQHLLDNTPEDNVLEFNFTILPNPTASITQAQSCEGDSLRLIAAGGENYQWFGPGGFIDSVANPKRGSIDSTFAGTYMAIAMDSNFCIDTATIILDLDTAPAINLPPDDSICDGFSKTISAEVNPFHTYYWNIGETSPNITVDSVYDYIVTVTNQKGCSAVDTFSLDTFSVPVLMFTDSVSIVCENGRPIPLDIASPAGGYYASALVSGDTLYPGNFGVYPLKYVYGDTNTGCSASIDTTFRIRKAPSVTISPLSAICLNGEADTIIEHAPKGGSFFNSPAMVDSIFNPGLAGVGVDTLWYQFTDAIGCSDTASQTILVHDTLAITLSDTAFCKNKGRILLEQPSEVYSGISGSYSGSSALIGNYIETSNANSTQTLLFSVSDTNNCISKETRVITIDTIPVVTFGDDYICLNAGLLSLNSATPVGGVYWGTGVNNDSLDPLVMGLGLDTVYYSYTLPSNGCSDTAASLTYVNPPPTVNLTLPDSTLERCVNAIPAILSGQSPLGGTFSGNGISSKGIQFMADTAGAGVHPITYSFTNSLGCTSTAIDTIEVFELPTVTFALYDSICENSVPDTLNGGLPLGGFYSGSGVNSFGVFRPNLVGAKTAHTITYNYTDTITGCYNFSERVVRIDSLTPISLGLIPDYCINVGVDTLIQGSINSGSFNYFGNGITNGNEFDPVLAGLGAHLIGYECTNLRGCSDSLNQTIEVFDTSNVTLNIPVALSELCTNDAPFTLSYGLPLGGFYDTLTGIVGNQFNPSIAGPGSKTIRYTYSNSNNCVTSKSQTIVVNSVPVVTHLADSFCFNESTQVLSNGLPFGGKYTGSGMINDSIFNPLFSGVGSVQLTYTFSEPITGCTNSAVASYTVFAAPTVSLSNLSAVCENKTAFNLNAGSSNGTLKYYSGNGITDSILGTFNPSIAQSGSHLITYIAINNAGCSDTISKTIKVDTIPVVTIDTLADLCAGAASFSLTIGNPKLNGTGIYTGQGVSGKTYFPSVSGVGTDEIIYQFTDLKGCKSSDTTTLTINALPKMVAAKWNSYCVRGDSVVLNGSLPAGGIYSNSLFVDSSTQKMAIDSVGIWSINYAYTDTNGCSNSILQSLQVRDLPSVSLSFPSSFCSNTTLQPLTGGSPLGASGVYKGDGVVGNFYNVDSVALSSDTLWYIYSDIYGCTDSVFQAISIDTLTSLTAIGISDLCEGSANVNLEPYFTPAGGKFSGFNVIGNQFFTSLLSEGSYPITYNYTDSNNCKNSIIDTVQIRSNPTATISNDTSMCTGETIRLIASGGLSYEWNTGELSSVIQVAPDSTSSYSVEVTNEFNCSVKESVLVTVYENFGVFTSSIEASCGANNGSGSVTVVNGKLPIQYFWSTGDRNSSASGLMAGTYTITILDGNSCEQYASLDVSNVGGPKIVVDSVKDNLCYGASDGLVALSVNSSIPSAAIWSNGSKTNSISNLSNGLYSVSIKDSLGCSSNRTFEIKSPDELTISYEVISPLCDSTNGHIIVFVEGGTPNYNYNWLGQSNTTDLLSNVGAGEYNLEVFDDNQCLDTFSFNLNNVGGPEFRLDSILSVDCGSLNGGVYITAIDTVKSYLWSNGKTVGANSGITVGTYTVTITDTSNCVSTESFVVDYSPSAMASLCYITYDTSNGGYNEIVWDTVGVNSVDGYSIYRESAEKGQYSLLGNVAKGLAPVFVDSSLNSQLAVGNYAIETYNACAKSEYLSPIHKSILLTTQEIGNDIVQINWSGYQGIDVTGYHVFRYSTTTGFKLLDSTAVNVRSYNDYDAPKEESELFYFVIARGKDVCTPEGAIVSNFSRDFGTGIFISTQQPVAHFDFEVYPNPNKGEFNVKFNNNSSHPSLMRVYNTQGQIVFEKTLSRIESKGSYSIKLRDISDGLYYLQLIGSGEIKTTQVIINQ